MTNGILGVQPYQFVPGAQIPFEDVLISGGRHRTIAARAFRAAYENSWGISN